MCREEYVGSHYVVQRDVLYVMLLRFASEFLNLQFSEIQTECPNVGGTCLHSSVCEHIAEQYAIPF